MVSLGTRRWLGLVVGARAIHVAEVSAGRSAKVVRHDRFQWPQGLSMDKPRELGQALGEFLRSRHYGVKQAVIGLPARWTLLKDRTLPPASASAVPAMLKLMIEREYQASARDWVFDYIPLPGQDQSTHALLAAVPQQRLQQVAQLAQSAGLAVSAVVPTTFTCLAQRDQADQAGATLMVDEDGAELAITKAGRLVAIERLVAGTSQSQALAMEVGRLLAMHQIQGGAVNIHDASPSPADDAAWQRMLPGLATRKLSPWNGLGNPAGQVAAAWGARPASLIDFAHSRLAQDTGRKVTRLHVLGALAILAVAALALFSAYDWYARWREVDAMRSELAAMQPQLVIARANVDRLRLARGWYDDRPRLLDAMRAITLAFPTDGLVWGTNLTLRDDMTATLTGKAQSERAAIDLMERMRAQPAFTNVKLVFVNKADRASQTANFSMTFLYTGKD